jgi:predicted RNA-binding Zn-ribbon protein involved in translation (DUF1610 family)
MSNNIYLVKPVTGTTIVANCSSNNPCDIESEIKHIINDKEGIPVSKQRLIISHSSGCAQVMLSLLGGTAFNCPNCGKWLGDCGVTTAGKTCTLSTTCGGCHKKANCSHTH